MHLSIVCVRKDGGIRVRVFLVFGEVTSDTSHESPIESFDLAVRFRMVCSCSQIIDLEARADCSEELRYELGDIIGQYVVRAP